MTKYYSWDLFCKIVDNYGDIGVSYRLAKELAQSYKQKIRLFVSDLKVFKDLENKIDPKLKKQKINNIEIILWNEDLSIFKDLKPAQIIIEMFACNIPSIYIDQITENNIWINLEYLSAETWIEDCHMKQSYVNGHFKYFFFPGFTNRTGGLNYEEYLIDLKLNNKTYTDFIHKKLALGSAKTDLLAKSKDFPLICGIFCYENNLILKLLANIQEPIIFVIFEGRFANFLRDHAKENNITKLEEDLYISEHNTPFIIIPLSDQETFDQRISAHDFNIIRGEDSFVRAQILATPFIWNIYQQENNAHLVKLESFLELYTKTIKEIDPKLATSLVHLSYAINDPNVAQYSILHEDLKIYLDDFNYMLNHITTLKEQAQQWKKTLIKNNSLAYNLIKFAQSIEK